MRLPAATALGEPMTDTPVARPRQLRTEDRKRKVKSLRKLGLGEFCCWCLRPFSATNPPTLEHLTPLRDGGSNALDNLALAHRECNEGMGRI